MTYYLGIDTSNYTTSVALIGEDGTIAADERRLLEVKEGRRGLRQQEALFQHVRNLPELMARAMAGREEGTIRAIGVSTRPRSQEGSYMPVFLSGQSLAESLGAALRVPVYTFSHQDGHTAAALTSLGEDVKQRVYAFHLSGGTCELIEVEPIGSENGEFTGYGSTILGATEDISFGQVLDRIGVAMGHRFPAGAAIDSLALEGAVMHQLTRVKCQDRNVHLSGLESQCQRALQQMRYDDPRDLAADVMETIAEAICAMTEGLEPVLLMGGVSESRYLRKRLGEQSRFRFPDPELGRDNAVGIAQLCRAVDNI